MRLQMLLTEEEVKKVKEIAITCGANEDKVNNTSRVKYTYGPIHFIYENSSIDFWVEDNLTLILLDKTLGLVHIFKESMLKYLKNAVETVCSIFKGYEEKIEVEYKEGGNI